jgi:hypothetical protein
MMPSGCSRMFDNWDVSKMLLLPLAVWRGVNIIDNMSQLLVLNLRTSQHRLF